jgi:uncharacterized iron-regulated protein
MHLFRCFAIAVIIIGLLQANFCNAQQITRMSDRQSVSFAQMMEDIESSKVILVGETHHEKAHHKFQLDVITALHEKGIPLAIGLEMFPSESQRKLDRWNEGKMIEPSFQWVYNQYWSEDWLLYRDIFVYARDNHIPLIGLNISKETMGKVFQKGFAALDPEDKKNLPPDVTCVLNTPYTEFLRKVYSQHIKNEQSFTYFCEAQTLYNEGMAWNIANYLKANHSRTFVTLAGAWHAVKNAIPEQLERYLNVSYKVIVPEIPGFSTENATSRDADYFFK